MIGRTADTPSVSSDLPSAETPDQTLVYDAPAPQTEPSLANIADRARALWEARGRPLGTSVEFWNLAQAELTTAFKGR